MINGQRAYVDESLDRLRATRPPYVPTPGFYERLYPMGQRTLETLIKLRVKAPKESARTMQQEREVVILARADRSVVARKVFELGKKFEYYNSSQSLTDFLLFYQQEAISDKFGGVSVQIR